jgi:hypothetical protein
MTHSIEATQLAELAAKATEIANRNDYYARIVLHRGQYTAVPADALFGIDVYVVFPDGAVEPWNETQFDAYHDRARDMIIDELRWGEGRLCTDLRWHHKTAP